MKNIVEVGGGTVLHSWQYYEPGDKLRVFEPNPRNILILQKEYPQAEILPFAIWKENTILKLHDLGDTSFVKDIISPAVSNNLYSGNADLIVEARKFDEFDDGTITHLWIDTEGCEYYVLEKLKSTPFFISVEMAHVNYQNPNYQQIKDWMSKNQYKFQKEEAGSYFYTLNL